MPTTKRKAPKKKTPKKRSTAKSTSTRKTTGGSGTAAASRRWSADVTKHSNALDLDKGVFKKHSPKQIAHSLEHSADESTRRKSDSYRSAMSMLTFYMNRAGKNLPESQKKILNKAKDILRQDHERTQGQTRKKSSPKSAR